MAPITISNIAFNHCFLSRFILLQDCPKDLVFNSATNECDTVANVPSCAAETQITDETKETAATNEIAA